MAKNDKILIDSILEGRKASCYPSNDIGEVMELFANEQIMRYYDLSQTDLQQANVDGKDDGGIDSFYIFINGILMKKDEDFIYPKTQVEITVVIIQCKHSDTFEQAPVNSLCLTVSELFDLSKENNQLKGAYNADVISKRNQFIAAYKHTACNLSRLNFKFYYVSRGEVELLGDNIVARSEQIKTKMKELFSLCDCSFDYLGASELLSLHRKQNTRNLNLPICSNISTTNECFIALSNIKDYFRFITDEEGNLKRFIFDSNVRDYMGLNQVNMDILDTLRNNKDIEFWWLNNGITILASSAVNLGTELSIKNVQIVNGLQTSYSIYEYFHQYNTELNDSRKVLIKVVSSDVDLTRDKIIQATNNQTPVELKSLYATDKIQQDIEAAMKAEGLFYERRINYYVNQGFDREKIFDMMYLAGGSICLFLRSPECASTLKQKVFKNEQKYNAIFNPDLDIRVWPKIALLLRKIDTTLRKARRFNQETGGTEKRLKKARYVIALIVTGRSLGTYNFSATKFASINLTSINEDQILEALDIIMPDISNIRSKHLSRNKVMNALRAASDKWGIDGMEYMCHVKNEFIPKTSEKKIIHDISPEIVASVKASLSPQPWQPNEHRRVAKELKLQPKLVYQAIDMLIAAGEFYEQKDGIVYDREGNVLMVDESRISIKKE